MPVTAGDDSGAADPYDPLSFPPGGHDQPDFSTRADGQPPAWTLEGKDQAQ
jgi:hypothetical protein